MGRGCGCSAMRASGLTDVSGRYLRCCEAAQHAHLLTCKLRYFATSRLAANRPESPVALEV